MKLSFKQKITLIKDFWVNRYSLKFFPSKKKSKFAIVCAGGAYGMVCTGIEGLPTVKALQEKGYAVFMLRYRTKPKAHYPNPQDDLARAVKYILDNCEKFNVMRTEYSIWGYSAGGHLAASFGTDNMGYKKYGLPKPSLLVLCYPVITMGEFTHFGSKQNLLGKNPTTEEIAFASVENHVGVDYPATYIWCCEKDNVVPDENARLMDKKLTQQNILHKTKIVPGIDKGHGITLGDGTGAYGWLEEAVEFWETVTIK